MDRFDSLPYEGTETPASNPDPSGFQTGWPIQRAPAPQPSATPATQAPTEPAPAPTPAERYGSMTPEQIMLETLAEFEEKAKAEAQPQPQPAQPQQPQPQEKPQFELSDRFLEMREVFRELTKNGGASEQDLYDLAGAVIEEFPMILEAHRDYVLHQLGLSPAHIDAQMREYADAEFAHNQKISAETTKLFNSYVQKGQAAGLNPLEAAGLAALAYQQFQADYYQNGAMRKSFDEWESEIRSGHKLGPKRDAFNKTFDEAFQKVAAAHRHHVPNSQPSRSQQPAQTSQFVSRDGRVKMPGKEFASMSQMGGDDIMELTLRERGLWPEDSPETPESIAEHLYGKRRS